MSCWQYNISQVKWLSMLKIEKVECLTWKIITFKIIDIGPLAFKINLNACNCNIDSYWFSGQPWLCISNTERYDPCSTSCRAWCLRRRTAAFILQSMRWSQMTIWSRQFYELLSLFILLVSICEHKCGEWCISGNLAISIIKTYGFSSLLHSKFGATDNICRFVCYYRLIIFNCFWIRQACQRYLFVF